MFTQKDRVELEAVCAMDTDLTVGPQPRWKRRQLRAQQQNGEENNSCELNNDSRTPLANSSQSHSPQVSNSNKKSTARAREISQSFWAGIQSLLMVAFILTTSFTIGVTNHLSFVFYLCRLIDSFRTVKR